VARQVLVEGPQARGDLGKGDSNGLHDPEHTRTVEAGRC
jgi:hypothetical protein